ncbi:MAG: alpha/beta hydrolase [Verrucomicrobia bacterium]|nr:alpha/beta hydrolase [Verrucomicrobiota bacterium]
MTETLILIPGFANNELAWKHQFDALKDHFHINVLVMDRFSTRQEMVDYLLQAAPKRFILAGHSMGGWVAQAAAAAAPERISKLLLLNTWATPDPQLMFMQRQVCEALKMGKIMEVIQQHLTLLIHPSRLQDMPLLQHLQAMIGSFSIEALVRQLEAMLGDYSSLRHHALITAPTLVLHSRQDALFPHEHEALTAGIKNTTVALVEDCGHASTVEKPEEVTAFIRSFIEEKC